ncbi:MAG TPA: zf-HC2 domain-containing protein [Acidobacteriota bacterium]|nr:zf-HC2 domain-containing protein [Acidobacteriota bacterium]
MKEQGLTCREAIDFLIDYVEGEMSEEQAGAFTSHLEKCPPCRDYLETYREAIRMGKEACCEEEEIPLDPHLTEAILAAIRKS